MHIEKNISHKTNMLCKFYSPKQPYPHPPYVV